MIRAPSGISGILFLLSKTTCWFLLVQLVVLAQSSKYNKLIHAGVIFATKKFMLKSIVHALFYIKLYANQKWSLTVLFNICIKGCSNMGFCKMLEFYFFILLVANTFGESVPNDRLWFILMLRKISDFYLWNIPVLTLPCLKKRLESGSVDA